MSYIKGSNKSDAVVIEQDLSCEERDEKDKQWRVAHLLLSSLLSWSALLNHRLDSPCKHLLLISHAYEK